MISKKQFEKQLESTALLGVFLGASSANNKIRQLEKEADWLALRVAVNDKCLFVCQHGKNPTLEQCQQCFREQAREAISHDRISIRDSKAC